MNKQQSYVLLAGLLLTFSFSCKPKSALAELPEGRLVLTKGDVTRNGQPTKEGEGIGLQDRIVTGAQSAAEIVFGNGMIAHLGSLSDLRIDRSTLQLDRGSLAAVKNAGSTGFDVVTPAATATVRGTSFFLNVEGPDSTYVCTCNGTVHFHSRKETEIALTAAHHSARTITLDGKITETTLKYHDDTTIEAIAPKINHPLDWTRP